MKRLIYFFLVSPAILAIAWIVVRVATTPENHISFDPYVLLIGVPFALIACALDGGSSRFFALLVATLCASTIFFVVHFNMLLQYEDWITRGMPNPTYIRKD